MSRDRTHRLSSRLAARTYSAATVIALLCLSGCAGLAAPGAGRSVPAAERLYVVAVSARTYADFPDWRAVVDALAEKHHAKVVQYDGDVSSARTLLTAWMPDLVCFVARPEEAGRDFVVAVHRMMRKLDDDIYTDAIWGILTGYDASDALRIARRREPLIVTRGASGAGPGRVNQFQSGFGTSETMPKNFWIKKPDGQWDEQKVEPDPTESLVRGFNTMRPQFFVTSGHASEQDWQVGYNVAAGQFRNKDGQLYGINTQGKTFALTSPEPKVYLAAGNCLIGRINKRDCMATAWMHTGGVYQMYGYTAVTWFGRMGWGVLGTFMDGRHNLAESFYWVNQSLMRDLHANYPQFAKIDFETYEQDKIGWLANRHQIVRKNKDGQSESWSDPMGLLWDRDVVAFYGDPGWDARMPKRPQDWTQEFTTRDGVTTFTFTPLADKAGPGAVEVFLPERLTDIEIVSGQGYKPVITDNFLTFVLPAGRRKGVPVRVSFRGKPMVRPNRELIEEARKTSDTRAQTIKAAALLPAEYRGDVIQALGRAGENANALIAAIRAVPENQREGIAFLIANMPDWDLHGLDKDLLVENVAYAYKAWRECQWSKQVPKELFLNDVLPYANLDEPRDRWRKRLFDQFREKAWKQKTPGEAAKFLNANMFPELKVSFHRSKRPRPNMSPLETMAIHTASCTGLSVLFVDACRAVGIPARVAGIPMWTDKSGNHTWAEVWDGQWYSLGAAEPTGFNGGWYIRRAGTTDPSKPEHCIYAASFRKTGTRFIVAWDPNNEWIPAVNVTAFYQNLVKKPEPKPDAKQDGAPKGAEK